MVILPGLGRPTSDVAGLAQRMSAAGYTTILPETRGVGESVGPMEGITLRELAADVVSAIDAVGVDRVVLVGHAFGNRVARAVAAYFPERVSVVVLLAAGGNVGPTPEAQAAIDLARTPGITREQRAEALRISSFGPGRDVTPWLDGGSPAVAKACMAAAAATPTAEWWTAGTAPMLIVQGLADVYAPPANGRMLVEEVGERARLIELEGVGHSLPVEAPDEIASVLIDYLSSTSR